VSFNKYCFISINERWFSSLKIAYPMRYFLLANLVSPNGNSANFAIATNFQGGNKAIVGISAQVACEAY
jgi:hypothetical protein